MFFYLYMYILYLCYALDNIAGNSESLEQLLQLEGLVFPPWQKTGEKTTVTVSLDVSNLKEISDDPKEIGLTFYLHETWKDHRLAYNETLAEYANSPVNYVTLPTVLRNKVWMPDIHIKNAVSVEIVESPNSNYFLRIYPNGTLVQSTRINCVLVCPLVEDFPRHHQTCVVKMESYSYSIDELSLEWIEDEPVDYNSDIQIPSHNIISTRTKEYNETFSIGTFSCLSSTIELEGIYNVFPIIVYFPSILLVLLAWASFWIDRHVTPARTSLCALLIMAEITHSGAVIEMMVNTSIWEPVEIWIGVCLIFMVMATLEFVVVHTLTRLRTKRLGTKSPEDGEEAKGGEHLYQNEIAVNEEKMGEDELSVIRAAIRKLRQNPGKLDTVSRVMFPVLFAAFNLCYWLYFLV